MSEWENKLEKQSFWAEYTQLKTELEITKAQAESDVEALENYSRVKSVFDFIAKRLDSLDPHLLNYARVQEFTNVLSSVRTGMTNFRNSRDKAHLRNAANHCDGLLNVATTLLPAIQSDDIIDTRERITEFRRSVGQNMRAHEEASRGLSSQAESIKKQFASLEQEIQSQKGRLDTAISEFQQQFSKAEETRRISFDDNSTSRTAQFQATIEEHRKTLLEALEDSQKILSDRLKSAEEDIVEHMTSVKGKTKTFIDGLELNKQHAEKLIGIITNTGDASGFQRVANEESKRATFWQWATVISMIGIVVFAVIVYSYSQEAAPHWMALTGRILAVGACGIIAAYGAKQVDRHRQNEKYNRRLELILLSLDTYLASLPPEKTIELKANLATLIFDPTDKQQQPSGEVVTTATARDFIELILKHFPKK